MGLEFMLGAAGALRAGQVTGCVQGSPGTLRFGPFPILVDIHIWAHELANLVFRFWCDN